LGYDHASDNGQMTALEYALRDRLGIQGSIRVLKKRRRRITTNLR
jgi:hypothetical protein